MKGLGALCVLCLKAPTAQVVADVVEEPEVMAGQASNSDHS